MRNHTQISYLDIYLSRDIYLDRWIDREISIYLSRYIYINIKESLSRRHRGASPTASEQKIRPVVLHELDILINMWSTLNLLLCLCCCHDNRVRSVMAEGLLMNDS